MPAAELTGSPMVTPTRCLPSYRARLHNPPRLARFHLIHPPTDHYGVGHQLGLPEKLDVILNGLIQLRERQEIQLPLLQLRHSVLASFTCQTQSLLTITKSGEYQGEMNRKK